MATAVALTLALAACGGDDDDPAATPTATAGTATTSPSPADTASPSPADTASPSPADTASPSPTEGGETGTAAGKVTIAGCEPQNPLVPTNTNETCGGDVVDAMFTGLISYDATDASAKNAIAESIETDDNKTYTIKIKADTKFHDGTPVTAKSFVDAWNYGAAGKNAQANSYFFDPIMGYAEAAGTDADGDGKFTGKEDKAPTADKMTGLKVVDDTTFTVELAEASSSFPQRLGYTAFAPMPESFFSDAKAWEKAPIGNGPFKLVKFESKQTIDLTAFEDYTLEDKPQVKDVSFKIYDDPEAAYADLVSNNIDVQATLPTSALQGEKYKEDLGDRVTNQAVGVFQSLTIPEYRPELKKPELRKAISMAIDRQTIIDNIFVGTRQPATGWVSPVVAGFKEGACGENCTFDPEKAKAALKAAGGFDETLTISYNADGGHKEWVDAACNSIKETLEIECQGKAYVDFATFLKDRGAKKIPGAYRTGWQMDYPAIENFLAPLYATGASANDSGYSNKEFDALIKKAATQDGDESLATYQQAEALLAEDMQVIPLWYGALTAGHSENVEQIRYTPFGTPDLTSIKVKP
jgi:oligopeptide transport system substrate-binding protein